ncbi:Nop14-like protein, partial [Aureobasidium melanogenum]
KQSFAVIETLIRHLHSLSRTYPGTIGKAFRTHMSAMHESGVFNAGDLVILTAISSIYPTSDHFHQVVTPAITLMGRWLEMNAPAPANLATGAFIVALCIKYQSLSKRYIPEAVRYTVKALQLRPQPSEKDLQPHVNNLLAMAELWSAKTAFGQIFSPAALSALQALKGQKKSSQHLSIMLSQARLRRRPLELHHHRPLPIRTSIPKFEENFNPDKHYDPDRERADAAKLKKEYKRERKGAVRELRKDANFIAREQLREKKERDAEYEKKYKRLVAEIQGEEGHEAKQYEREKRMRKSKR